jgi:ribose-phosphate pyrophosphokinase
MRADQGIACMYKTHRGKEIRGHGIMGDVKNKLVVIYDDLISSGKTVLECCEVCRKEGAREALAVCASHGLFVGNANEYLDNAFIRNIIITDTVKPFRITNQSIRDKLNIINTTHLFAAAIQRIHGDESISDLIQNHLTK